MFKSSLEFLELIGLEGIILQDSNVRNNREGVGAGNPGTFSGAGRQLSIEIGVVGALCLEWV